MIAALVGGLIGAGSSYLGAKEQTKQNERTQWYQATLAKHASKTLRRAYDDLITDIGNDPTGFAGRKVRGEAYRPVDVTQSQRGGIQGNLSNLGLIEQLVGQTNEGTLDNDVSRARRFDPMITSTLGNLGGAANDLSRGQLPGDVIQDIFSNSSSRAAAFGTPGGSGPTTLRDLGLNSLDARNQGAALMQQVLQGSEAISPISRQIAAPQFFLNPGQVLQTDLQQAGLDQQSRQNIENLDAAPDPHKALLAQLRLQGASQTSAALMGQASLAQANTTPYSQIYGQIGNALNQGIQGFFGSGNNSGGGGGFGSSFSQGFGAGSFNPAAYNGYAVNYNQNLGQGGIPKAYAVT